MAQHSKTCAQCDEDFTTRWRKSLYCHECQILRSLEWGLKPCNCEVCGKKYWPIKKTYVKCPECQELLTFSKIPVTDCVRCHEQHASVPGTSKWCLRCVSESQKTRRMYHDQLRKNLAAKKGAA